MNTLGMAHLRYQYFLGHNYFWYERRDNFFGFIFWTGGKVEKLLFRYKDMFEVGRGSPFQ